MGKFKNGNLELQAGKKVLIGGEELGAGGGDTGIPELVVGSSDGYAPQPICLNGLVVPFVQYPTGVKAYVSVADFLVGIVNNDNNPFGPGGEPYTYGIQQVGDAGWIDHIDPRQAIYEFTCSDPATVLMRIRVFDQAGNYTFSECYVLLQDNMGLCP